MKKTLIMLAFLLASTIAAQAQCGVASWYGGADGLNGNRTASGERFNTHDLTAAHRTLPFGTMLTVTNQNNGKTVTVKINDRGPFHGGRIIDLSSAAASEIGIKRSGTGPVCLEGIR